MNVITVQGDAQHRLRGRSGLGQHLQGVSMRDVREVVNESRQQRFHDLRGTEPLDQ